MSTTMRKGGRVRITADGRAGKTATVVRAATDGRSGWLRVDDEPGTFFYTADEIEES